jgi:hypothetical protein
MHKLITFDDDTVATDIAVPNPTGRYEFRGRSWRGCAGRLGAGRRDGIRAELPAAPPPVAVDAPPGRLQS